MSKRYPPVFNVILFVIAVLGILLNPTSNMLQWLPELIKGTVNVAVYAIYNFYNTAGEFIVNTYNNYAIFTLHIVIIALYGKQLFSKDVKDKYQAALKTINESYNIVELNKAMHTYEGIMAKFYALSALTISLIVTNIIVPNFYQFNILQFWGNYPSDATVIFVELLASTFLALLIIASVAAIGVIYGIPNMANTENRAIQLARLTNEHRTK